MKNNCPPQGRMEPWVCPEGHFCPDFTPGAPPRKCEGGHYCPFGSVMQIRCSWSAYCPRDSQRQIERMPVYVLSVIDLLLIALAVTALLLGRRKRRRAVNPARAEGKAEQQSLDGSNDFAHDMRPEIIHLVSSFRSCIGLSNPGLTYTFQDLAYEPQPGHLVLQNVSGTIASGALWAIMGPSGAGKTTFLNLLMGRIKPSAGFVEVNGQRKMPSGYKKIIGYVPQDDIILPELTVRENILHSAKVRLPRDWKDDRVRDHVDALISCLGLWHVKDCRVGDATRPVISGGQRKRVNIGLELAAAPMALFLDEPTSGLDASSAASVMGMLKHVSRLGVTTVATMHQPRQQIFRSMDNIMLLGDGHQLFAGPQDRVESYFAKLGFQFPANVNPADVLIDVVGGNGHVYNTGASWRQDSISKLVSEWETSREARSTPSMNGRRGHSSPGQPQCRVQNTITRRGASRKRQFVLCFRRAMLQQIRNPISLLFEILIGGLAGLVIGLSAFSAQGQLFKGIYKHFPVLSSAVDYQNATQIGLLSALAIGLATSAAGVRVFGEEKLIYWREAWSGHSRLAYFFGKVFSTFPRIILACFHFSVFQGILATPPMSFIDIFTTNLLYFFCIYGFAHVVSVLVQRSDGPLVAVMSSLIIGILGGVAPPLSRTKSWHVEWLWRLSPATWFTEIYFSKNVFPMSHLFDMNHAQKVTGFNISQVMLDRTMLFILGLFYRVAAFLLMVRLTKRRQ